jgi:membrane protease YdiL (CAAX protease family)
MSAASSGRPRFWETVSLLLGASRKRATGRQKRQSELLRNRAGKAATDWSPFTYMLGMLFGGFVNVMAAIAIYQAVTAAARIEPTGSGRIAVSQQFMDYLHKVESYLATRAHIDAAYQRTVDNDVDDHIANEALDKVDYNRAEAGAEAKRMRDAYKAHGSAAFAVENFWEGGLMNLPTRGSLRTMYGSIILLWWAVMLVCQGEGLELDLQRRRHPMWEWLFSHPAPPGAIFLAELLAPIAANPIYWGAPLFVGVVYSDVYGVSPGILAAAIIGIPFMVALACMGKALEISIVLRFSPRSRGAMIGLITWLGYASLMLMVVAGIEMSSIVTATAHFLQPLTAVPWPLLGLFIGQRLDGTFSILQGIVTCVAFAACAIAGSVWFATWGAQQGLAGNFGSAAVSTVGSKNKAIQFGKEPLYRKELLWFIRDRSAIVQTILIPLTVAGYQLFNMRGLIGLAANGWNSLCGVAILFGTYFLWVLGPKSLSSEGAALWISLTWPRGLESLLKAKAWLWTLISSGIVGIVLLFAAIEFPESIWKIALAGVAWFFFGRSMAEKTVTLVTVTSESGEPQKIPRGRRWAASLGMLTFAIGVFTQQWHIAVMGIVYSYLTAAAMWQNFRARLPYLYDVWSETLPPAPTLMHAMIAISLMVEVGAVLTGIVMGFLAAQRVWPHDEAMVGLAQSITYCICAVAASVCFTSFLASRDVPLKSVLLWPRIDNGRERLAPLFASLITGAAGGAVLGLFALLFLSVAHRIPSVAEAIDASRRLMAGAPDVRIAYGIAAVGFAPFAEEFLFRGVLYRALDREWGGWHAVLGSAAFFAIYHQPLSWIPVGLLGATNAILFKKTGRLGPAILLHMVYNAVVVLLR